MWSVTTREEIRIEITEMKLLRRVIGKTRREKIRNESVRKKSAVVVCNCIDSARLRW